MPPATSLDSLLDDATDVEDAWSPRVPLLKAATAQCLASVLMMSVALLVPSTLRDETAMSWVLSQGVLAALVGHILRMDPWWLPIHLLFVPGLVWTVGLGLSPVYPLAGFLLLASLFWGVARTRVPLFFSSRAAATVLAEQLPPGRVFSFVDLGCGLGGVLGHLARQYPLGRYTGVETAPAPFLLSWLRSLPSSGRIRIRWADFATLNLGEYDVVYAYLSPAAMPGLWEKAQREMRPGSLLISNSFAIPGMPPAAVVATGNSDESGLLLWRM